MCRAKAWVEKHADKDELNFKDLCEMFTDDTGDFCDQLHQIFVKSFDHVNQTLDLLMHYSLEHKVLEEPGAAMDA